MGGWLRHTRDNKRSGVDLSQSLIKSLKDYVRMSCVLGLGRPVNISKFTVLDSFLDSPTRPSKVRKTKLSVCLSVCGGTETKKKNNKGPIRQSSEDKF
jgi:hypothetical protein